MAFASSAAASSRACTYSLSFHVLSEKREGLTDSVSASNSVPTASASRAALPSDFSENLGLTFGEISGILSIEVSRRNLTWGLSP